MIVSNVETLFLVESLQSPDLSRGFTDRVLVSAETGGVPVRILLNKTDLASDDGGFAAVYDALGYPVTRTSAVTGEGIEEVASFLRGGIYAFVNAGGEFVLAASSNRCFAARRRSRGRRGSRRPGLDLGRGRRNPAERDGRRQHGHGGLHLLEGRPR